MQSRNDMELPDALFGAPGLVQNVRNGHLIGAGLAFAPAECAELAAIDAEVRGIDVHVLDEIHPVGVLLLRNIGGHAAEGKEIEGTEQLICRPRGKAAGWKILYL